VPILLYSPGGLQPQVACRRTLPATLLCALAVALLGAAPVRAQGGPLRALGRLFDKPPPPPGPSAPARPGSTPEVRFQALLRRGTVPELNAACQEAAGFGFTTRLQLLAARLLTVAPAPQPLPVVLANAQALLSCRAPDAALTVLDRFSPAPGSARAQWLVLRWRAAQAGLRHRLAAEALEQLAAGRPGSLELVALPFQLRQDGSLATRPALDVYAEHLEVLGRRQEAAAVLLAGSMPGQLAAERLRRAVALLDQLPLEQRDPLLERALDQAAAAQAWGLALALLDDQRRLYAQAGLPADRATARLQRLSQRVDDAYSEWQLRRQDPQQAARTAQLQQQLRSPHAPGGHATSPP
jgi:hypothetical protein